jgi:hypothetical protein
MNAECPDLVLVFNHFQHAIRDALFASHPSWHAIKHSLTHYLGRLGAALAKSKAKQKKRNLLL